ncbi:hypothetical protein AMS68_007884 [Peltaster fructicola]|uniref:Uncharacterized protein n=1 Tax=Peltaster fructicola TaxID=286661 RepID=A0A6H0Y5N8_9PEZI|nr:hypothetical protein AMS68_007884 [Peltaster fructicola]
MAGSRSRAMANVLKYAGSDIMKPEMRAPLASLLSQAYGKPVEINFTNLSQPHLDAGMLATVLKQQLQDRKNTPNKVIRSGVLRVQLPSANSVPSSADHAALAIRALKRKPSLRGVGMRRTTVSQVIEEMKLKKVSSLRVETAGRLGKRMTANRSAFKSSRKGLSSKGPGCIVRGVHPLHAQPALKHGKRRVGAFGVRVTVGHS